MHELDPESQYTMADEFARLAHQMATAFDSTFCRDLVAPFDDTDDADQFHERLHHFEHESQGRCKSAILEWIPEYELPELDDRTAFYLFRRFEQASEFLMKFLVSDRTMISYLGDSLGDFIWWILVDWWEGHGQMEAFLGDLEMFELKHPEA